MIVMVLATFGIIEGVVHTVGTRLFHTKHFYTPGMITVIASIIMIVYLAANHLAGWYDYVFGLLIMMAFFACLQKTMTLMVGINYSDMPGLVKAKWNRKA